MKVHPNVEMLRTEGGTIHLPCGTCISWSTMKYSGKGMKTEYTTEIRIGTTRDSSEAAAGAINVSGPSVYDNTCMVDVSVYGIDRQKTIKLRH